MTTKEVRLENFIRVIKTLKTNGTDQKTVAEKMKVSPPYLSAVLKKDRGLTLEFLEEFFKAFPEINQDYILKNEGPIFLSDKDDNVLNEPPAPFYKSNSTTTALKPSTKRENDLMVYNLDEQNDNRLTKASGSLAFPGSQHCDFAIIIHGEAMRGAICNGGAIGVKQVKDKSIIPYGHIYFITLEDYDLVRYIVKSDKEDYITLRAHNQQEFQDFDIPRKAINSLYKVRKILNNES